MAALRTLSSTSTSIMRSAFLPRFSLNHAQIRTVLTVTAFEKAMEAVHGGSWKQHLNRKQKIYIEHKEGGRERAAQKMKEVLGDDWEAAAAKRAAEHYETPEFKEKFRVVKADLARKKS